MLPFCILIVDFCNIDIGTISRFLVKDIQYIKCRGNLEIEYLKRMVSIIEAYIREEAINELIAVRGYNKRLGTIKRFMDGVKYEIKAH